MQRLVLDRDLNDLIEENIKNAWEGRTKNEREEFDPETENISVRQEAESGELAETKGYDRSFDHKT